MEKVNANAAPEVVEEIQLTYHCPKCEIGYLRPTGLVLRGEVDKYMHKCDNLVCCHKEMFTKKYS